jgi:hypothetical protein
MSGILPIIVFFMAFYVIRIAMGGFSAGRKQTVEGMLISKRLDCTRHHHGAEITTSHTPTRYYITFQPDKGRRMELIVSETQYDLLFEGERGKLTYRGNRFIRFKSI